MKRISFCTALINRGHNFFGLYSTLKPILARGHQFLVADYGSTDIALEELGITRIVYLKLPFRKSQALNRLAQGIDRQEYPIVAFVDADMLVPDNFDSLILEHTSQGHCYFPICFSFNQHGAQTFPNWKAVQSYPVEYVTRQEFGWWRTTGYGNCAFFIDDFFNIGQWNERFDRWGQEDVEMWKRVTACPWLTATRAPCPGFYHQWHPSDLGSRNYYWKKNSAD